MTGIYYVEAADWLRAVGLTVVETDGWQTRARSSGGFAQSPWGIQFHHTASSTTPESDIAWQTTGSDDAPIGNMTIMRDGSVWLVAAGAANTAGKGGPVALSRGTVPKDSGNSTTWAIEAANDGVGEPWPQAQIDAYFTASNELNRRFGNQPTDVFTHALGAGDGYTDRKIDPATAAAVQGPWRPSSCTSSGTWSLAEIRDECSRRASTPPDPNGDDMPSAQEVAAAVWAYPFRGDVPAQVYLQDVLDLAQQIGTLVTDGSAVWNRDMRSQLGGPAPAQVFLQNIYDLTSQIGTIVTELQGRT